MANKIGLFFGSSTGNTEFISFQIKSEIEASSDWEVEVINIGETNPEKMLSFQYLIMGIPTWNTGEVQDDWDFFWPNFQNMDFSGKKVAIFGLGDQNGYGYNFLDAAGMLADAVMERGADLWGVWSRKTYEFEESKAVHGDYLLNLGIDQDGQENMTSGRIKEWSAQVLKEFSA